MVLEYEGNGAVIWVSGATTTITLSNLTIRQRGGVTDGSKYGAVGAKRGSTVQVDLSSEVGCGVTAQEEGTDLRLKDYTMHNCKEVGVQISSNAKATVEGCTSRDNRLSGIQVQRGGSATLRGNTSTGNQVDAICIYQRESHDPACAVLVVENNQLTGNTGQSLFVSDLCRVRVQQANNTIQSQAHNWIPCY